MFCLLCVVKFWLAVFFFLGVYVLLNKPDLYYSFLLSITFLVGLN